MKYDEVTSDSKIPWAVLTLRNQNHPEFRWWAVCFQHSMLSCRTPGSVTTVTSTSVTLTMTATTSAETSTTLVGAQSRLAIVRAFASSKEIDGMGQNFELWNTAPRQRWKLVEIA